MKTFILICGLFFFSVSNAQYYYQSGSPTDLANWNTGLNGGGVSPASFNEAAAYWIPEGRTAVVFSPWSINGPGTSLRVRAGGVLKTDLAIEIGPGSYFHLDSGALYIHNNISVASQTIFHGTEIFEKYSTVRIDNWSGVNQPVWEGVGLNPNNCYFGNLEINWASLAGEWNQKLSSSSPGLCSSDFIMDTTGTGIFRFHDEQGITGRAVVKIFGDFIQNGGFLTCVSNRNTQYMTDIQLYGNFRQYGGALIGGGVGFGRVSFARQTTGGADTAYQTFYSYFPEYIQNMRFNVNPLCRLRLLSNFNTNTTDTAAGLYINAGGGAEANAAIDFQTYKVKGSTQFKTEGNVSLYIKSPFGFRDGDLFTAKGNLAVEHAQFLNISPFSKIFFSGAEPQITGSGMPDVLGNLYVDNPNGVTLSKNLKVTELYLINGKLNLSDYNLIVPNLSYLTGISLNNFINTNGDGFLKTYINVTPNDPVIPIGNGNYSPLLVKDASGHNADTFSFRVKNGFSVLPSDTSFCVRKTWEIIENTPGGSSLAIWFQWMREDEGINFKQSNYQPFTGAVGVYNYQSYNGYKPFDASTYDFPFLSTNDTNVAHSGAAYGNSGFYNEFNAGNKFVVGMYRGIYEYYFYNTGNGASLNSWKKNENGTGNSPLSFDRYEVFNVIQNKNAVFNTSAAFSNKTMLYLRGNGQLTANQPITNLGRFEMADSSFYNHNNIGVAANTIFAGVERFGANTTFNITMWSDTANAIRDGLQYTIPGNLVINFTNLVDPGTGGRWRNSGMNPSNILCYNLNYIQSSGYDLCPVGNYAYGASFITYLWGNLKLGDSLIAPDANPIINLSYVTSQSSGSAGALSIGGNLDIQRGKIKSEDNIFMANGRLGFNLNSSPKKYYISSYQPESQPIYNVGNFSYPSTMSPYDTLVLRSNFYNSQNIPGYPSDFFEVPNNAVFDCDTFAFRGMHLRVKKGGKVIIRNKEGMNFELNSTQSITFEEGSMLELAGNETQKLYKAGTTPVPSLSTLIINNSNGIILNEVVTVTDTLKFIRGKVSSDVTYLNFTDTTGTLGMSSSCYIEAPVKLFTASIVSKWIPFGKDGKLRPMNFQASGSNPAQWILSYTAADPHTFGSTYEPGINNISSNEYYTINNLTPGIGAYVGLSYGSESGVTEIESLRVARWSGAIWENKGAINYLGNQNSGYIISGYTPDFGNFAISSVNAQPLPVELAAFSGITNGNNVTLKWSTSYEFNNTGFDVERRISADTIWKKISFVQGAGNSNSQKNYQYEDKNTPTGKYSYRLKQIDYNGIYKYYTLQNEINVGVPNKFELSQNYPNPFNPSTKINFSLPADSKVTMQIYDMTGRLMGTVINSEILQAGYHTVQFNGNALSSGTYFYRLTAGEFVQTKKMTLVK